MSQLSAPNRTQLIAGVTVAQSAVIDQAVETARSNSAPFLFNHLMRSWLFAEKLGQLRKLAFDGEVLAIAVLAHDMGLVSGFEGPYRFEVDGANLGRRFAIDAGLDARRTQLVWDCIALHTTASIAQHKEVEVMLCSSGIGLDFGGNGFDSFPADPMAEILDAYPRRGMKNGFMRCFCHLAETKPATTHDNFAREFGERFVPGYKSGRSVVDMLMNSPFDE